jgi:anti-anti-sigma factor
MPHHHLPHHPSAPEGDHVLKLPCTFTWTRLAESGGSIRLVLAGELDLAERPPFASALADAQTDSDRVLLDLGALTLIDCANLFVVFSAARRSRREGAALILLSPRGQVRRVFDLLGAPPGVATLEPGDLPGSELRVPAR